MLTISMKAAWRWWFSGRGQWWRELSWDDFWVGVGSSLGGGFFFYFSKKFFCNLVSMYNLFRKFSKCKHASFYKKKLQNVQNPGIIPPKFSWSFDHSFNEPWPTKKNFFWPEKKIFLTPFFWIFFSNFFFQKVIETMVTLCPEFEHGQNP